MSSFLLCCDHCLKTLKRTITGIYYRIHITAVRHLKHANHHCYLVFGLCQTTFRRTFMFTFFHCQNTWNSNSLNVVSVVRYCLHWWLSKSLCTHHLSFSFVWDIQSRYSLHICKLHYVQLTAVNMVKACYRWGPSWNWQIFL